MAKTNSSIAYGDNSASKPNKGLSYYVEDLLSKRMTNREAALVSIVEALRNSTFKSELGFLENNFATYLYRCLNFFKKGSATELQLAAQAIGLLAMIIGDKDDLNEIYRDLVPVVSKELKSRPKTVKVFECLALATFYGASNPEETQDAMKLIWEFLLLEAESSGSGSRKKSPDVVVAAITAWLFLLSSLNQWGISAKYWRGAVSYFLGLLENDEETYQSVRIAASVALALIYDMEDIGKFVSREETYDSYSCAKEALKASVLEKLECHCLEQESDYSAKKVRKEFSQVYGYFKNKCSPRVSKPFGRDTVELSSWSKIVQLNYLKNFLGNQGLNAHMLENPKVQNVFKFRPTKYYAPRKELYTPAFEDVTVKLYLPQDGMKESVVLIPAIEKAMTRLRTQTRKLALERKQTFSFEDDLTAEQD